VDPGLLPRPDLFGKYRTPAVRAPFSSPVSVVYGGGELAKSLDMEVEFAEW
jgi:hypothetical protein